MYFFLCLPIMSLLPWFWKEVTLLREKTLLHFKTIFFILPFYYDVWFLSWLRQSNSLLVCLRSPIMSLLSWIWKKSCFIKKLRELHYAKKTLLRFVKTIFFKLYNVWFLSWLLQSNSLLVEERPGTSSQRPWRGGPVRQIQIDGNKLREIRSYWSLAVNKWRAEFLVIVTPKLTLTTNQKTSELKWCD